MRSLLAFVFLLALAATGWAASADSPGYLMARSLVSGTPTEGAFTLVDKNQAAPLLVADNDWPGVRRAAGDLQADIERVTGRKPTLGAKAPGNVVIIGTVGKSALIDALVAAGKLDVTAIRGKWEAFVIETVEQPMPGVERALVSTLR